MAKPPHLLVIDAPYYEDISQGLMSGVTAELEKSGAIFTRIKVPGVLEIPAAIAMAMQSNTHAYDGYVVIGCVIRGETTHYDIVANESARAIMDLSVRHGLAIGNGIQTVENVDQARVRANPDDKNKGGAAAQAALAMIRLRQDFSRKQDE